MDFSHLSLYLERLEKTSSRLEITRILAELFKEATNQEIEKIVNLLLGQIAPPFKGIVFNLAEKLMIEVLSLAYSKDVMDIKKMYKEKGDLGDVAYSLSKGKKGFWDVSRVYEEFKKIAMDAGEGSQERKINAMAKMLSQADPLSARYLARIPLGKLRLGFSDKTIIDALSYLEVGDKSKRKDIEKFYQVVPDIGLVAKMVKEKGILSLRKNRKPVLGIPVLPMLAQRLKSPQEMIEKMKKVFVEPKYDGLRILIHYKREKRGKNLIKAFTRNLNEVSYVFPELQEIGNQLKVDEVILDCEAVGVDPKRERLVEFQVTMQRRRKYGIEKKAKEIPIRFEVFDILFINGKSLLDTPYYKRREILSQIVKEGKLLSLSEAILTDNPTVIAREYKRRIGEGLEGIMVKKYDSFYIPGRTGWRWVKMKEEEKKAGKLADTIDCLVMGYYKGRGKRAVFGLGGFLVGVLDGEVFKSISKIGTGLTDEQFKRMYKILKVYQSKKRPKEYAPLDKSLIPDLWTMPQVVVEVAADEITKSPVHSSGYALRFPRMVRIREDKGPFQVTTLEELKSLQELQKL